MAIYARYATRVGGSIYPSLFCDSQNNFRLVHAINNTCTITTSTAGNYDTQHNLSPAPPISINRQDLSFNQITICSDLTMFGQVTGTGQTINFSPSPEFILPFWKWGFIMYMSKNTQDSNFPYYTSQLWSIIDMPIIYNNFYGMNTDNLQSGIQVYQNMRMSHALDLDFEGLAIPFNVNMIVRGYFGSPYDITAIWNGWNTLAGSGTALTIYSIQHSIIITVDGKFLD